MKKLILSVLCLAITNVNASKLLSQEIHIAKGGAIVQLTPPIEGKIGDENFKKTLTMNMSAETWNVYGRSGNVYNIASEHSFCTYNYQSHGYEIQHRFQLCGRGMECTTASERRALQKGEFYCTGRTQLRIQNMSGMKEGNYEILAETHGLDDGLTDYRTSRALLELRN